MRKYRMNHLVKKLRWVIIGIAASLVMSCGSGSSSKGPSLAQWDEFNWDASNWQ
ncbi:hypothetical protein [Pleionea litopenaei]|uniref:Uncharacterized protein n=1 Tax=Pleionea litopenaei TaxID=3070815 RepID=A0AA51RS81_9GAMM|nr:hypothetical protein [Pleionea sp. HL-JVS1]WMS86612.1 hypothetical protein Q9312_15430 [Pleionea sp. HL-JVS1]